MNTLGSIVYDGKTLDVKVGSYRGNNRVSVMLDTDEGHWENLSVNVPGVDLAQGEFILHHDITGYHKRLLVVLLDTGWFEFTGKTAGYGFVSVQPIWRVVS